MHPIVCWDSVFDACFYAVLSDLSSFWKEMTACITLSSLVSYDCYVMFRGSTSQCRRLVCNV